MEETHVVSLRRRHELGELRLVLGADGLEGLRDQTGSEQCSTRDDSGGLAADDGAETMTMTAPRRHWDVLR